MTDYITVTLTPQSPFLLGGISSDRAFDAVTSLDSDGFPFVAATAFKGATRMEFESLIRNWLADLCEPGEESSCSDNPCLACRLFGGANRDGKLRFNAAVLSDEDREELKDVIDDIMLKGTRQGVAISRTMGTHKDGSYYTVRTFPNLKNIRQISLVTSIDIQEPLTQEEREYLDAFFAFLERTGLWMGSRKSAGFGHFAITCKIPDAPAALPEIRTGDQELKMFIMELKTKEPLVVGGVKNQYIIDSLPFIPASTMGGGIGFALKRNGLPDNEIDALFNERKGFTPFSFYPSSHLPKPASLHSRKGDKEKMWDILPEDFILGLAIQQDKFAQVKDLFNSVYRGNYRAVAVCDSPDTEYTTKLALDRNMQKNKKGMLYQMECIEKGTAFQGLVIGEAWIQDVLKPGFELFIGGKRGQGFGRTAIKSIEPLEEDFLVNDPMALDARVRELAETYSIELLPNRQFYALQLLADCHTRDKEFFERVITEKLFTGLDIGLEKSFPRLVRQGGYDYRNKKQKPMMEKIGAGSVFLVSVPNHLHQEFIGRIKNMITQSNQYEWDETPLFRLYTPVHTNNGGNP